MYIERRNTETVKDCKATSAGRARLLPGGRAQVIAAVGEIIGDVTDPLSYLAGRKMPVTP